MEAMVSKKAMVQILVSLVSVFSLALASYSSVFLPLLSTLSMQMLHLFSYSSERNYIFVLCNGILILIIKNSGLIADSSRLVTDDDIHINHHNNDHSVENIQPLESSQQIVKPAGVLFIQEEEEAEEEEEEPVEEKSEREQNGIFLVTSADADWQNSHDEKVIQVVEVQPLIMQQSVDHYDYNHNDESELEGEEDEEGAEELNKRCEEFIKRMKEDIRTEARSHLLHIMIN